MTNRLPFNRYCQRIRLGSQLVQQPRWAYCEIPGGIGVVIRNEGREMVLLRADFGFQRGDRISTQGWGERQPGSNPPQHSHGST